MRQRKRSIEWQDRAHLLVAEEGRVDLLVAADAFNYAEDNERDDAQDRPHRVANRTCTQGIISTTEQEQGTWEIGSARKGDEAKEKGCEKVDEIETWEPCAIGAPSIDHNIHKIIMFFVNQNWPTRQEQSTARTSSLEIIQGHAHSEHGRKHKIIGIDNNDIHGRSSRNGGRARGGQRRARRRTRRRAAAGRNGIRPLLLLLIAHRRKMKEKNESTQCTITNDRPSGRPREGQSKKDEGRTRRKLRRDSFSGEVSIEGDS